MKSSAASGHASRRLALHLLPVDLARGAQRYAVDLRSRLSGDAWEHQILVLFRSESRIVDADVYLDVPRTPFRRFGFDPRALMRLRQHLQTHRPTVVIAHGSEPYKYASIALPSATPLLYYRIGVSQAQARTGLRRKGYQLLTGRADLVAGVSHETLDDAHETMDVPRDRLHLIPNGRDAEEFERARKAKTTSPDTTVGSPPHLIWVSHLTTGKRPDWFVEVVRRLRADGLDLRATLVGDGPMLDELADAATAADVDMLGHRSDIPDLLVDADIFCFTSSGESEGMPGVLIEAGLAGLATVSTAVPGASTVIEHGTTGFIAPADDLDGFVKATAELVRDRDLRARVGRAALDRCGTEFTLDASANRFQETIDKLAGVR